MTSVLSWLVCFLEQNSFRESKGRNSRLGESLVGLLDVDISIYAL